MESLASNWRILSFRSAFLDCSDTALDSRSSVYLFFFCRDFMADSRFFNTRSLRRSSSLRCGFAAFLPPFPFAIVGAGLPGPNAGVTGDTTLLAPFPSILPMPLPEPTARDATVVVTRLFPSACSATLLDKESASADILDPRPILTSVAILSSPMERREMVEA